MDFTLSDLATSHVCNTIAFHAVCIILSLIFLTGSALAEVSEAALLRDVLFVFQNIDGRYVHFDSKQDAFRISDKV